MKSSTLISSSHAKASGSKVATAAASAPAIPGPTDFTGRVVLITGGGSGMGRATALAAARAGAKIAIVDLNAAAVDRVLGELRDLGADALGVVADTSQEADVERYVAETVARFGAIHCFFNNAGVNPTALTTIADTPVDEFDRILAVNTRGVFMGLRAVIPHIVAAGGGSIVCTGSIASERGLPYTSAYNASKHAVVGLVKTAAVEFGPQGVRVNAVLPGMIKTPMLEHLAQQTMPERPLDEAMDVLGGGISPLGRAGTAEQVAATVLFLLSDASAYVTGASVPVEGGAFAGLANGT